uniref:Uncharacterized protein n=1 Tax=Rhizophora mucronata TaxID=61149 RepID=A0A2P2NV60_RHIMU
MCTDKEIPHGQSHLDLLTDIYRGSRHTFDKGYIPSRNQPRYKKSP